MPSKHLVAYLIWDKRLQFNLNKVTDSEWDLTCRSSIFIPPLFPHFVIYLKIWLYSNNVLFTVKSECFHSSTSGCNQPQSVHPSKSPFLFFHSSAKYFFSPSVCQLLCLGLWSHHASAPDPLHSCTEVSLIKYVISLCSPSFMGPDLGVN